MFFCLLLQYYYKPAGFSFWVLFFSCVAGLSAIYLVKFFTLKICGWLFRLSDATDAYSFVVFTTNKIIGIAVLPLIILIALTEANVQKTSITVGLLIVATLFVYRYFISYSTIHPQIKINFFHFILYLLAFEIIPLLLINKLLVRIFAESY
jgi:hypothetical protein